MASTDSSPEPSSIIVILHNYLKRGTKLAEMRKVGRGDLQPWANGVRFQLARIYGKNAPQLTHFPPVASNLSEHLVSDELTKRLVHLQRIVGSLEVLPQVTQTPLCGKRIFIGHGRSPLWRELKDFIVERHGLPYDEFNREPVAGHTTTQRLQEMMSQAAFALLVMTAEEEGANASLNARPNVIHEAGLFHGCLGPTRAIVLLEEGCSEFSNIIGLCQIRFPRGNIAATFEEVRRVLEREGLL